MIDTQTLYLVGFVSQATFALTMALLAWSDRRSRGMVWLAAGSGLQLLATAARFAFPSSSRVSEAVGSCLLVLIFFCAYMGLRWFVVRHELRTSLGPALLGGAIGLVLCFTFIAPHFALIVSRLAVVATMLVTMAMLWRPHFPALRITARIGALQLGFVIAVMVFRVCVDLWVHGPLQAVLNAYGRGATLLAVSLLSLSFIALFGAEAKRRLHVETRTDALTGLSNRRAIEEAAMQAIGSARQTKQPLALLMLDMDNFKTLNDTWGHWLGDRALHALGSVLLTGTGTMDVTARMGGEEFAVLLPGKDAEEAGVVAERLREAVQDLQLTETEGTASLSVSIGVSVLEPGERSWAEMLRRADKALYRAKREGRNRVVLSCDEAGPPPEAAWVAGGKALTRRA